MASNYVIMSIKLCLDVGNDKDVSLYNFGGLILSGFEVIEGEGGGAGPRWQQTKHRKTKLYKKPCLNWFHALFPVWS